MSSVVGVAESIRGIEMIEGADEPGFVERGVDPRFALQDSLERSSNGFVLANDAAGDKVGSFRRLIQSQADQRPAVRVLNDNIYGDEGRITDDMREIIVRQHLRRIHSVNPHDSLRRRCRSQAVSASAWSAGRAASPNRPKG